MQKKDKCVMFATSSAYVMGVANVIIGIEKYSPGLIDNYVIYYDENDPIKDNDVRAFGKISDKTTYRKLASNSFLSVAEKNRRSSLLFAKFHVFDLLKEYRKVLYLEADMLIQRDISKIFSYGPIAWRRHPLLKAINGIQYNKRDSVSDLITDTAIAANSGVVLVNDEIPEEASYVAFLYECAGRVNNVCIGMNRDEVALSILPTKYDIKIDILPEEYNCTPFAGSVADDAAIIHTVGANKFWNDRLLSIFYPEWHRNYNLWRNYGGSEYIGEVRFEQLGTTVCDGYKVLSELLNNYMDVSVEKSVLRHIIDFAGKSGSWSKKALVNNAEFVCAYGLGDYFDDTFTFWNFKEKFNVKYCCDKDIEKGKSVANKYELNYIDFERIQKLSKAKNVIIILFLRSPYILQEKLIEQGIYTITAQECIIDEIDEKSNREEYFSPSMILETFDAFRDIESKIQFNNLLAHRMAVHMATYSYASLATRGRESYFDRDIVHLGKSEVFVDCGAWTGNSIDRFLFHAGGQFDFIYAYELDKANFDALANNLDCAKTYYPRLAEGRCKLINAAVSSQSGKISYGKGDKDGTESYTTLKRECNPKNADMVTLDETIDKPVTYLKVSVEGMELDALRGAKNIIKKFHPVVAVRTGYCLRYMWIIPQYLKSLCPEYKLYLRHYGGDMGGTVLYALFPTRKELVQ